MTSLRFLSISSFFFFFTYLSAQKIEPLSFGQTTTITSKALNEDRRINVYLPQGFHPDSSTTYPVIYVLDGSMHEDFPHIAGLVQFMNMYDLLPKSIVVGIANVDRYRDFTSKSTFPEDLESLPTSGGAVDFIQFLKEELKPWVERQYPVSGKNMIIGQSLGGLLATEVLMSYPDLFDQYVIVSPSLWWKEQALVNRAADYFTQESTLKKQIYLSLGKEHPVMHEVADKLADAIQQSGNQGLELVYDPILEEDHATILHLAVYRAFKYFGGK